MNKPTMLALGSFICMMLIGCSSTEITNQDVNIKKLPKPGTIWVYDFVANPADIPGDSALAGKFTAPAQPLTPEEVQIGQQLGSSIAKHLVQQINSMGLHSEVASTGTTPQIDDIVLKGYIFSLTQGNAAERIFIGFGYGASQLDTMVEGYQMTNDGLRKLGSADLKSVGGQTPGGGATGAASFLIFGNPISLIIGPVVKGVIEMTGGPSVDGRADSTAELISEKLQVLFQEQGWISQN